MPSEPEDQDAQALAVEGDAEAPEHEDAERQDDLEPPPPDGECHPGVGVEGLDVVALRHRGGGGGGRRARRPSTSSTTMPKWASTKPTTIRPTMSASTIATKRAIRPRPSGR